MDRRTLPVCRYPVLVGYIWYPCNKRVGHDGEHKPKKAGQNLSFKNGCKK